MSERPMAEDHPQTKRRRSPHDTVELFAPARFVPMPLPYLTSEYVRQVGADGLRFVVSLIVAYDQGRYRHRGGLTDGWLALPDSHLARWWGYHTTDPVRKARAKVLAAQPPFLSDYQEGASGLPSEYQIRRLSTEDRVLVPFTCAGMVTRRPRTTAASSEMADIAVEYVKEAAFSVFPVDRHKVPYVRWKEFQSRKPTEAEIRRWLERWPNANLAVATGAISDLVVVDIDGDRQSGIALLRQHGVELPATQMVETGRGGVHFWFAYPGVFTPSPAHVLKEKELHIDVRGDGGYAVVPPSVSQNGKPYRFADHVKRTRPVLPESFRRLLEKPHSTSADAADDRNHYTENTAAKAILAKTDIVEVIQRHGVVIEKEAEDRYRGLCPFHHDTTPSFVVTPSKGLFHCFGCEAAGNAIQFVQKIRDVGFADATRFLR